jgi:predicted flap endonuclease-1-like 5' DNA nuclease
VLLKTRKVTNCGQLLAAAAGAEQRDKLKRRLGLDNDLLLKTVQRADLARIEGVGAVFGMMLEDLGIMDVADLQHQDYERLHAALDRYNKTERLARRSPTIDEVRDWVDQANRLEVLVTY